MSHFHVRRSSLSRLALLLASVALFATACDREVMAPDTLPETQPIDSTRTLGLVEVTISGIGTPFMLTSARSVAPAALRETQPGLSLSVSPVTGGDGSIQLEPVATGSFTDGERGAGGVRYMYATFKVRNAQSNGTAYAAARTNLTFLGVAAASTLGESAIKSMQRFDGSDADAAIAADFIPTGGVARNAATGAIEPNGADVLQVLTEAEAGAVSGPAGVTTVFPYGFVVRNPAAADGRTLPASPAVGQFDGVVTFAYKVPLQATATEDPFTVTALFLAADDGETRITESLEEQGTGSVQAGADALGGTAGVTLLGNSTTPVSGHGVQRICRVRTAGTDPLAPAATLVDAGSCTEGIVSIPGHVRVVDADASAGGNGEAWGTAFNTLQDALACVRDEAGNSEACGGVDEIWVAEGSYYPDEGAGITENDANAHFDLVEGVSLYGGFAGYEYSRGQRDWETHATVLDGDIDQDGADAGNSFVVVSVSVSAGEQITRATVVDGFTVRHGVGSTLPSIVCSADGAGSVCSPELDNLIVSENHGGQVGAMLILAANGGVVRPLLQDVTFSENTSTTIGGALFMIATGGEASPSFVRVTFDGNVAGLGSGGALYARSSGGTVDARFTHAVFRNNVAIAPASSANGGAVYFQGGGTLRFADSEFWNNTVRSSAGGALSGGGGAIFISGGVIELTDVTLANNGAAAAGDIGVGGPGALTLNNTIIWGNANPGSMSGVVVTARSSLIEGGCPSGASCTGVVGADPQFVDLAHDDLRLGGSSPAVDAGGNIYVAPDTFDQDGDGNTSEILPFDLAGRPRILDWGGDDAVARVDMGAYERQP